MTAAATPSVPVSWGELIDKITILGIKREMIRQPEAHANVTKEYRLLCGIAGKALGEEPIKPLVDQLISINRQLWEIEDAIREKEVEAQFGADFVGLARSVYKKNDQRAALKRAINQALGSELIEEKSYRDYLASRLKIGVLTFHRCFNYGSYWQARCVVEGLRAAGNDAELLDHDCRRARWAEERCLLQPTLPEPTEGGDLPLYKTKGRRFLAALNELPRSSPFALDRPEEAGAYDVVIIGSDEVWNFRHPWYGSRPVFFGDGLRAGRLVSYAASFGNHNADDGIHPEWSAKLRNFAALSVRDANSARLVRHATGREPPLVLDPCLQFPQLARVPATDQDQPYALVYGHGFPGWLGAALQGWRSGKGLRLISVGYRNAWADEQRISASPEEFAALMAGAEAVITNFFHGCVFALLHAKPFISIPSAYRLNKVRDLALALGAEHRIVGRGISGRRVEALLEQPTEKRIVDRIEELRHHSAAFFRTALA